jgi:hypothetical protein
MKNFLNDFIDFITGGFFNYMGAAVRFPFSKKKFSSLAEERLSNSVGMLVMTILLIGLFLYIKFSI